MSIKAHSLHSYQPLHGHDLTAHVHSYRGPSLTDVYRCHPRGAISGVCPRRMATPGYLRVHMASNLRPGTPRESFGLFQSTITSCPRPQTPGMHIMTKEAAVPLPNDGAPRFEGFPQRK